MRVYKKRDEKTLAQYKVYNSDKTEVLAEGSIRECYEQTGIDPDALRSNANGIKKGIIKDPAFHVIRI